MIDCSALSDRMPETARGTAVWSDAEAAHIRGCVDCSREWRLVQAGSLLHARLVVDADRIANGVVAALRAEPVRERGVRRIPWRGALIGFVAAAAAVVAVVSVTRPSGVATPVTNEIEVAMVLPELQALDDNELEVVLRSLGPTAADATPGTLPHLEDLTDNELEQLLSSKGVE